VKIKVALHGMDKRCEDRMLTIFNMNFKGQCEHTDIEQADTVIIDMDDKDVDAFWAEFRLKYPEVPAIIMATDHVDLIGTLYVSKPAKLAELLSALKESSNKEIGSNLSSALNTQSAANALHSRDQKTQSRANEMPKDLELFYSPNNFLQGKMIKAIAKSKETEKNIFLKYWKDHWVLISPHTKFLVQNINDQQIKTLGLVQIGEKGDQMAFSEHLFSDDEIAHMANTPASKVKVTPIDQFMWAITVKTARGRAPEGTSLDDLYVLQHWPNLPKLSYIPNATRISAFWLDQPQSINNIISKLKIPQEDVLTYFSAAVATGILKQAKRKEDYLCTPDVIKSDKKKQGIFSALINKVSRNISRKKDSEEQQADYV